METKFPTVLTLEQAAKRLSATTAQLEMELESERLCGFRIAGEWRITEERLLDFVTGTSNSTHPIKPSSKINFEEITWVKAEPFEYKWPSGAIESHAEAYQSAVKIGPKQVQVLIGFTARGAAGLENRKRVNVFLRSSATNLRPMVEFAGSNDFEKSGQLASVVKLPTGKHLKPGDPVPSEYADMPLGTYSDIVVGPYAACSTAVVAHAEDLSLMARHALIRARWKNLI